MENSCLVNEANFAEDYPHVSQSYSNEYLNNEKVVHYNDPVAHKADSASISLNDSTTNLKIDAPEFVPLQKLQFGDSKSDGTMDLLDSDNKTTAISKDSQFDIDFKTDVLFLLQHITKKLSTEFSKIHQNQGDLLFKNEDRVNFLQKMFLDEINKEKQKFEEEKIKNVQLEAKLESVSEILARTTKEKEEQLKQNVLLKNGLEKQLHAMNDFQKEFLTEYQKKCSYMKTKLQQVVPYITNSVPWYEDFQANLQAWTNYEVLVTKHLASVESNLKLLKIVDSNKLDNFPTNCEFPFREPKSILNDVFLHVIHSYNCLYRSNSATYNQQPNHVPQTYNNYAYYQPPAVIEGAPVYYTGAQSSGSNIQYSSAHHPNSQYQRNQVSTKNMPVQQQTFKNEEKIAHNDRKTLSNNNLEYVNNPEENEEPNLSLASESNPITSQPSNSKDSVTLEKQLPLSPNISQLNTNKSKKPITMIKESLDFIQKNCLETDRATQGTSETHFDDLYRSSPETERKLNKFEAKFYDASLDIEEQIENLSANVKAAGGTKFLHLFLYLWQNIPYATEETLLQALLSVKKTVGKFTGMKKESILISVKRILEPETENASISDVRTEVCTICYESFSTSKTLRLKCGHTFHYVCGKKWLVNNNICPICRFCVLSEDDLQ